MFSKKDVMTKEFIQNKTFSYKKKDAHLSFTLRVDNSSEIRPFISCLEEAILDLKKELEGIKN